MHAPERETVAIRLPHATPQDNIDHPVAAIMGPLHRTRMPRRRRQRLTVRCHSAPSTGYKGTWTRRQPPARMPKNRRRSRWISGSELFRVSLTRLSVRRIPRCSIHTLYSASTIRQYTEGPGRRDVLFPGTVLSGFFREPCFRDFDHCFERVCRMAGLTVESFTRNQVVEDDVFVHLEFNTLDVD